MNDEVIPLDRLAKIYIRIRTARQVLTQNFEEEEKKLKEQLAEISDAMKAQMQASGAKSTKTEHGTVILGQKTRFFPSDWEAFKDFIKENDALDLLERRVAQQNMAKFLEANPERVPPGLNSETEVTITVRKPS